VATKPDHPAERFQFVRNGNTVAVSEDLAAREVGAVLELFKSASYLTDAPEVATPEGWHARSSGTYMLVQLEPPRPILVRHVETIVASELLINFNDRYPDHLLVRTREGGFVAVTKYGPEQLADVACATELRLDRPDEFCATVLRARKERGPQ
jgi:hypothetical protein